MYKLSERFSLVCHAGLNLAESLKYFAELIVDVTEKIMPVSKVPSDTLKRKPYPTQQCKDAIKIKHRKWKKVQIL